MILPEISTCKTILNKVNKKFTKFKHLARKVAQWVKVLATTKPGNLSSILVIHIVAKSLENLHIQVVL